MPPESVPGMVFQVQTPKDMMTVTVAQGVVPGQQLGAEQARTQYVFYTLNVYN
jgi:hypothetical protein